MIKALLFTSYPKRFIDRHVIPKLMSKFDIEVLCIGYADRPTERCASEAEVVLCMHERMSHSSDTLIREIAKKYEPCLSGSRPKATRAAKCVTFTVTTSVTLRLLHPIVTDVGQARTLENSRNTSGEQWHDGCTSREQGDRPCAP
jgi:hypothetical protein